LLDESPFSLADFDRHVEDNNIQPGDYGAAFARWLANLAGRPITGEPVDGQGPTFTAEPEGVDS
jgi:hypothetical protein